MSEANNKNEVPSQNLLPSVFGNLLYKSDNKWLPLPDWAICLGRIAERITKFKSPDKKTVVALGLPTRAFASSLMAAVVVPILFQKEKINYDPSSHFVHLSSLPPGTLVTRRLANYVKDGKILGLTNSGCDESPYLQVQFNNEISLFPPKLAYQLEVVANPGELRKNRRKLISNSEFIASALPNLDAAIFSTKTSLDCMIVGNKGALEYEISKSIFGSRTATMTYPGSLQDILRTQAFSNRNVAYRSDVISAIEDEESVNHLASPPVVIFDGARGFNSQRSKWFKSNWIVVLDKSSPATQDGADTINQEYALGGKDSCVLDGLIIHPGIEVIAYEEQIWK